MKKDIYQEIDANMWNFFVCYSPVAFPLSFAIHPWIITVTPDNTIHKYQVHSTQDTKNIDLGFIHVDGQAPLEGDSIFGWTSHPRYVGKILYKISGKEHSQAHKMVEFVHNTISAYPHKNRYRYFPGPNSNTFVQRFLNKFPELHVQLPWNAFGKNYKMD
ncbi:MAG: DUF3750 domain-containing protein [candidate division SR1 bacterium]|nr:DUF3750 domain-containing protein [candidate division SR1 bacterium]